MKSLLRRSVEWLLIMICGVALPITLIAGYGWLRFGAVGAAYASLCGNAIYIPQPARNVDNLVPGKTTSVQFEVINLQSTEIEILGGRSSCGCAKLVGTPLVLEPHGSGMLEFALTPRRDDAGSELNQEIELLLDRPAEPMVLTLFGKVNHVRERVIGVNP